MKCTKCGAECDPRQLFCLRCGTPLNSQKSQEEGIREVEVPIEAMVDAVSLDDEDDDIDLIIGRDLSGMKGQRGPVQSNRTGHNDTYDNPVKKGSSRNYERSAPQSGRENGNAQKRQRSSTDIQTREDGRRPSPQKNSGKNKKNSDNGAGKKKVIIGVCIAVVCVIVVLALLMAGGVFGGYDKYYRNGMNLYEKGNIQPSITQFRKAAEKAKNDTEKEDADEMLWKAYSQTGGYEKEQEEVLKELIELQPDKAQYYEALISLYQAREDLGSIESLIESVEDEELKTRLREYDKTALAPTLAAGEYDQPISVGLTAASGSTIYYTINGGTPSESSEKYKSPIELTGEGEYIIKAISVDEHGETGKQFEGRYVLKFGTVNPPVVSLDSGTYSEREKVKVSADAGCTVYYTTDGTIPDKDSKRYEKPFKIPEKNTVYFFIAIDEKGVSSDVVTRVYDYKRVYGYDYDGAVSGLSNVLVSKGIMENESGSYEDGSVMYFEYLSLEKIDKDFYYIIKASKENEEGETLFSELYAFGADNGMSYVAGGRSGQYELKEIE